MGIPADILARLGEPKSLEGLSTDDLKAIVKEYYERWVETESTKYDIEHDVKVRDMQIHELEMEVSDMRGKFIVPKLKKVHNFKLMGGDD
ncbi:troponin I [Lepeophtheirus salmonis]|uniref:Troponin Ilike [Metaseiulus occidentalis] n=1 Tax=Lepeophtheirus salmonis TaxID=72036 RepID=A0A0K2SWB8_LEPSM|nr:troponin I-like [Lepeophtheirus salmonis]XP_040582529.1 troponin I-like [Lepeophtheirus salmonis]